MQAFPNLSVQRPRVGKTVFGPAKPINPSVQMSIKGWSSSRKSVNVHVIQIEPFQTSSCHYICPPSPLQLLGLIESQLCGLIQQLVGGCSSQSQVTIKLVRDLSMGSVLVQLWQWQWQWKMFYLTINTCMYITLYFRKCKYKSVWRLLLRQNS